MDIRPLGKTGLEVSAIGVCLPPDGPREELVRRAVERGVRFIRPEPATSLPPDGYRLVKYNLIDQKEANEEIPRHAQAGLGVVATHVLAGGALARGDGANPRVHQLRPLVRPGRTLAQAAVQFVLANESVSCALVRVSSVEHLDEILGALDAPPLSGRDLELIFELWANRFD
jgi:aryl-alcohol dehydrogenase-like predicted oxidoreductase